MDWQEKYADRRLSAAEAIRRIPKGKHVFIGSGAAEPMVLVAELEKQASHFADNTIVHLLTLGPAPYTDAKYEANFRHNAFFVGANVRKAVFEGRADYTPVFLSQIPGHIRSRRMPVDVALVQVSPPDQFGYVNLGVSVDIVKAALESARLVIAEINPRMPVIYGSGFIPMKQIHHWVPVDYPLILLPKDEPDDTAREIGKNVASLIEDGATIQTGVGQIPDAAIAALDHHKDLGVWTEMFSDGVIDLIENGNITGKYNTIYPNKVCASFTFGRQRTYDYVDRNPTFTFHPSDHTNDPIRVAQQHKMVAINSALQIDLTGQVCADSIGTKFFSGIGGQVDFIRGASMCPGGKPIIAIRSTAKNDTISRIVPTLDLGAGVVTSRGDVRYVVTEYGIADLLGKTVRQRAMDLIQIAHPDFRADLLAAAKERRYIFVDQIAPRTVYPKQYETVVTAKNGRKVRLRPIRVADEAKMSDLFYNLSDQTIYRRWAAAIERMPHTNIMQYLDVDYSKNIAIVVETIEEGDAESEIIGVARYHQNPANNLAEVAFVMRDDWQGQGLGTEQMRHLTRIARDAGLLGFTGEVLAANRPMLHVFHKSGLAVQSELHEGVYSIVMPFDKLPTEAEDASEDQSRGVEKKDEPEAF
ncbi:MAG: GNAT family N-acetyltransferase [Deltaproteobacteria bacterium]|nr:GNAT family N-acetyltransferase [bacterium]MCB9488839.1 GNAT family N-acetyltransferase [Deltaproteobacteria bacterium]